ncbi:unnamed protein product [Rotaria socialis]|uniref:Uncharacterized protein n=1 Tax=Rotaria socialis TaxID=392032 RepID=A0A820GJW6_9BILA|nr:unnamed protein product [Rotaria socialis]CAF4278992.1 unnamed protein product [Rotaria socialis]
MYQFPNKVNQRRRIRQLKRQSVRQIIVPNNDFAGINHSNESISSYSSNNNDLILVSGRSPSNALSNTDVHDDSSSSTQSDEDKVACLMNTIKNPIFHGRRSTHEVKNDSPSHKPTEADSFSQWMETKYLMLMLVCQERLEEMMKSIYKNQKKIQKASNKRQMFKSNGDEPGIDLIKVLGTKDKANLYVTQLIQIMFTIEELFERQPSLFSEAVRIKFKLDDEQGEQLFSE